jgi:hypothetical protein
MTSQGDFRQFLETIRVGDDTLDLRSFAFPGRWNFTAVHRDGWRERVLWGMRVPDPNVAGPRICAQALRAALRLGAALQIERVK